MADHGIDLTVSLDSEFETILSPQALGFVARLQREFDATRRRLLADRAERQAAIDAGGMPDFLGATRSVREADWRVAPTPADLQDRRVEITGPTDRKMMINALNSGASAFMADFEDANSPTWDNMVRGQINLCDAVQGDIRYESPEGKRYSLGERPAVLMVRPRGWHLVERRVLVDGSPASASLFDFGLAVFHNARRLIEKGSRPYFYLPKLESHLEARLWNDAFNMAQDELGIPRGTIRATVLVETVLAAFEMDEILYELRDHAAGLNAGRWDYIFSVIKKFRRRPGFVFPDRAQVTMGVPFMRAYTELLVRTCHRRGAHAIGGMAAYIPSRRDPQVNEVALEKVREDKRRESGDGFDGTWVAHPDLVPTAKEIFDGLLGERPHQKDRLRDDVRVAAGDLLDFRVPGGQTTEAGVRGNLSVGVQYLESWLRGVGAAAINNLMEDTATAEIARAQVWQWIHQPDARLADGRRITAEWTRELLREELSSLEMGMGAARYAEGKFALAARLFDGLVTDETFVEFLTWVGHEHLE